MKRIFRMIDIHNHLLPGIDDGSRSLSETLYHLDRFGRSGATTLALTPHLLVSQMEDDAIDAELTRHRSAFADLLDAVREETDLPELVLGQEILAPSGAEMARVAGRPDIGLGASRALLVELGFGAGYDGSGVIDAALAAGRVPVLAHVERYAFPNGRDPLERIERWRDRGAALQVNVGSLLDRYSDRANRLSWRILERGLAHVVSSDHHGDSRPHEPLAVRTELVRRVGSEAAHRLLSENARRLLDDEPVLDVPIDPGAAAA